MGVYGKNSLFGQNSLFGDCPKSEFCPKSTTVFSETALSEKQKSE
jgi:hypothetical protein